MITRECKYTHGGWCETKAKDREREEEKERASELERERRNVTLKPKIFHVMQWQPEHAVNILCALQSESEKGFSGGSNVAARDIWKGVHGFSGMTWCEGSLWFQFQIHISGTIKSTARSCFSPTLFHSHSQIQWTCTLCLHFTHIVNVQAFSWKSSWLQVHFPFVRMRTANCGI